VLRSLAERSFMVVGMLVMRLMLLPSTRPSMHTRWERVCGCGRPGGRASGGCGEGGEGVWCGWTGGWTLAVHTQRMHPTGRPLPACHGAGCSHSRSHSNSRPLAPP
jgi:hypothetical protein